MPTTTHPAGRPSSRAQIEQDLADYTRQARHADADDYPVLHSIVNDLLDDWQAARVVKPSDVLGKRVRP